MQNPVIKWGILGYAAIARDYVLPAIQEAANAVPFAMASREREKLNAAVHAFGFQAAYQNYDALLADAEVEAVYIPLPNALHKEWVIKAAKAGKHILCEKPLALTAQDAQEMINAARDNHVKLMEAFMYRFTTRTQILMQLLRDGEIGQIKNIHSSQRYCLKNMQDVRNDSRLGGGSLWDVGCYPINLVGMILQQEPVSISSQKVMHGGIDWAVSAVLRYPGDVLCTVSSGFDAQSSLLTEINGTEGCIVMRDSFNDASTPILLIKNGAMQEIPVSACKRYVLEIENFSSAILQDRDPGYGLDEVVRNTRLMQRILQQAQ